MNHAHWAPAASCLSMVATSPHSLSAISLSGKAFFSASKSVASPAALVLWYTSRPIISTYASPGYQSLSFVSLVHTQIRLFSPFCLKVSYTSFQSRLYEAASFPTRTICLQLRATVSKLQEYSSASKAVSNPPILPNRL